MEPLSRRDLLAAASALAAGVLLPFEVKGASLTPEELEAQAAALTRGVSLTVRSVYSPLVALGTARTHYDVINSAMTRTLRAQQRRPLHRAASMAARICALASRWSGIDGSPWVTIAVAEAKAAGDGPLLAHAWMEQMEHGCSSEVRCDHPCPERLALATAALGRTGIRDEHANVRAIARQERAWDLAMAGEPHPALVELDMATMEADKAGWRQPSIHEMVGVTLRKVGRPAEAERSLTKALDQPPVRRVWVLCEAAQAHLALDDVDAAAQDLEEAFLLTHAYSIKGRLPRILAVRALLPPGRAAQELDEVMRRV